MSNKWLYLFWITSVWITPVWVTPLLAQLQTRPPVLRLSMKQAVQIALAPEGNTRVQLAQEALKQAEAQATESRAALLPDVESYVSDEALTRNLRALGLNFTLPPALGLNFPTVVGFDVFDARATVNQNLFDFASIRRFQASKVNVEATKSDSQGTQNQVTDQVARAYLTGVRAEAALETAQANVDLSEALLKLARHQKEAGTGTGIEITRAQVQLANDKQHFLVARNDVDRAHLDLLKILAIRLDSPIELTDKLTYEPMEPMEEAKAIETAHKTRAELRAQQQKETSASLNYSAVKWERLPSLSGFADYGSIGTSVNNAIATHTYGVTLRVPIFDGGRRDARRTESASLLRQERIRTADLKDQVELDVRLALDSLRSADDQVKVAEEGLQLSDNELAQARRRYEAGVTNSVEVTDAQTRLDRARDNRITALYNYNLARIDLATAMGTIQSMIH
jgi:outer membrane protein TolC